MRKIWIRKIYSDSEELRKELQSIAEKLGLPIENDSCFDNHDIIIYSKMLVWNVV